MMTLPRAPWRAGAVWHPAAVLAVALTAPAVMAATPYTPTDDTQVVETLPTRLLPRDEVRRERLARQVLHADPRQLPLALAQARTAIERSRQLGDPRQLGQAQAALAPWWADPAAPAAVRLLRAIVRQGQHDFDGALVDLDALRQDAAAPLALRAQAELTRASVLQVVGRWDDAAQGCQRLAGATYADLGDAVRRPAEVCLAELADLRGRHAEADAALARLAQQARGTPDEAWIALVRAEQAVRRGDTAAARDRFAVALADRPGVYARAAEADFLLSQGRADEVARRLADHGDADALLLRLAMAWRRLGDTRADGLAATLGERFAAAQRRGDATHAREQALWALHLRGDPMQALTLAQRNWQVQKEPADGALLIEAARAAGRLEAAQAVRDFASAQGWSDVRIKLVMVGRWSPA